VDLEDMMLSEISQSQRDECCMAPLKVSKVVKIIETESKKVAAKEGGRKKGELVFNGYKVSILQDEKVLATCSQPCEYATLLNCS